MSKQFADLENEAKLRKAKQRLRVSISADTHFQREAQEDFAFEAGNQWPPEEKRILEQEEQRPCLTFNFCKTSIDLVMGVNEQNRVAVSAEPTEIDDDFLADVLNDVARKVIEMNNVTSEEDETCHDAATCGRGFIGIDIGPDPKRPEEIKFTIPNIPIREVRIDPASRKDDLSDAAYLFWDKWLTREDFVCRYPKFEKRIDELMEGQGIDDELLLKESVTDVWASIDHDSSDDSDYDIPLDPDYYDRYKDRVRVVHMEYWATFDRYYGFHPATGKPEEFEKKDLPFLKKAIPNFEWTVIKDKKVKWLQFIGDEILYDGDSPLPFDGYSIVAAFGYKDKSRKKIEHYGIIRLMKDPQREVNKRWSQTLNLLMKQGQGGYFAEISAPADKDQWEQSIFSAGETTWVNQGAIAGGKIKEKGIPEMPRASQHMADMSAEAMKKITGINPDLLGLDRGRQEAGVVIKLRQQQGLVILAKLFRNFKEMKRQLYERILAVIMAYMPDEQIRRILGQGDRYLFRRNLIVDKQTGFIAPIRNLRDLRYNISVREAPGNLTKQMAELSIFIEMMQYGFPVEPQAVIEKLDLSPGEKQRWIKYIESQKQGQSQAMEQQINMKLKEVLGKLQIDMGKVQTKARSDQAKIALAEKKLLSDRDLELRKIEQAEREDKRDYAIDVAQLDQEDRKLVYELVAKLRTNGQQQRNAVGAQ